MRNLDESPQPVPQKRRTTGRRTVVFALAVSGVALALPALGGGRGAPTWEHFLERHDADGDGVVSQQELTATGARFAPVDQDGDGVLGESDFLVLRDEMIAAGLAHRADADDDGELTSAELAAWFTARDVDGNGRLDEADRAARKEEPRGRGRHGDRGSERGERLAGAIDADGDEIVELADFQALFARVDDDGDGVLSGAELPQRGPRGRHGERGRSGPPSPEELVARLDTDGDGAVSRAEWDAGSAEHPRATPERAAERFARLDTDGDGRLTLEEMPDRHRGGWHDHRGHHGDR